VSLFALVPGFYLHIERPVAHMALLRQLAVGARGVLPRLGPDTSTAVRMAVAGGRNIQPGMSTFGGHQRSFSAAADPYKELGVDRSASEADVKKAYKAKALHWHPDKNPDNKEEAQRRFAEATQAYETLKNPETRREFDTYGRVGGGGGGGPNGGPGGFHHQGNMSQADAERLFKEAFGGQQGMGMEQILQQMFAQQHGMRGGQGMPGPRQRQGLQVGMEVRVRADEATIHQASRACGISADNDERRARCAGKVGTIIDTDVSDQSVKMRVMVKAGRADEVWFGAGAVEMLPEQNALPNQGPRPGGFQQHQSRPGFGCGGAGFQKPPAPTGPQPGMEVVIQADVDAIHKASRACGIDTDNDERRARCAGKVGTIVDTDPRDKSFKVRVMVMPGRADEVWFGTEAVKVLTADEAPDAGQSHAHHPGDSQGSGPRAASF